MPVKFNPKLLKYLSPDSDDWNDLVGQLHSFSICENSRKGVLIYPKSGIGEKRLEENMQEWFEERQGDTDEAFSFHIYDRGEGNWAIPYYQIKYNHFELDMEESI